MQVKTMPRRGKAYMVSTMITANATKRSQLAAFDVSDGAFIVCEGIRQPAKINANAMSPNRADNT